MAVNDNIANMYVQGYSNTITLLSQQKQPLLFGKSRVEVQSDAEHWYDIIAPFENGSVNGAGAVSGGADVRLVPKPYAGTGDNSRHSATLRSYAVHTRRAVSLRFARFATLVDSIDKLQSLNDPTSAYVESAVSGLNRQKDDFFIAGLLGNAVEKTTDGATDTDTITNKPLPDSQKMVVVDASNPTTGAVALNVSALAQVLEKFNLNEVDPDETKYFALGPKEVTMLLNDPKLTSIDYASVKVLLEGKVSAYVGFTFVMTNRLPMNEVAITYDKATGEVGSGAGTISMGKARMCLAWAPSGVVSAVGGNGFNLMTRITEMPDLNYAVQVFASHGVGALRLEDKKVILAYVQEIPE